MQEAKELNQIKLIERKYSADDDRWNNQWHQQGPGYMPESIPGIGAINGSGIKYFSGYLFQSR